MKDLSTAKRILVVNDNAVARGETATILSANGYDVDAIEGASDRDPAARYDLVTLSWSRRLRADMGEWQKLQIACPVLRFTFVPDPNQHLARLFFNGRQIGAADSDSSLLAYVERALAARLGG